ncbi:EFR1 family ferrodoxin [Bacillota bacterium]
MEPLYSNIKIVYYSGTGGTAMVAESFRKSLEEKGCSCTVDKITNELAGGQLGRHVQHGHSLLLLLFPVHAFNAPEPVYKWIESLSAVNETEAAVISVSGGGEISPNTACRISSIKRLAAKGYRVVYETMIIMPSNILVATKEPLAAMLLRMLPRKVNLAVHDILTGTYKKGAPIMIDRLLSIAGEMEKPMARFWGRYIKGLPHCDGCGWCAKNCPSHNISIVEGKPKFASKCHMCLKCIYGCPKKALTPGICKSVIIKEGYDLNCLSEKALLNEAADVNELAKGYIWSGVKKYLLE